MASPGDLDALPPTELKALVEVHLDRLPGFALAAEHLAGARDTDLAGREVGTDAEGRSCPTLTLLAMTRGNEGRLAGDLGAERSTAAVSCPGHVSFPAS